LSYASASASSASASGAGSSSSSAGDSKSTAAAPSATQQHVLTTEDIKNLIRSLAFAAVDDAKAVQRVSSMVRFLGQILELNPILPELVRLST
jgi:hypothetical protein